MSKVKMLLDVVQDLRNLTDSLETLAQAMTGTPDGAQASENPAGESQPERIRRISSTVPVAENLGLSIVELRCLCGGAFHPGEPAEDQGHSGKAWRAEAHRASGEQYAAVMSEVAAL